MPEPHDESVRDRVFEMLLRKVEEDRYPSVQQLNMLEENMTERGRRELIAVLADKIAQDRFPSIDMIRRLLRLAG